MNDIFIDQKIEKERLLAGKYIDREGLENASKNMDNDMIKVVVGPRRAGKSVFAIQLLRKNPFAYLNFDDERLLDITDYDMILKGIRETYGNTKYLLFDEIQNLDRWELFVNRLQRNGYFITLTGSNSRLLSRELATHLTGRFLEYPIYPFSFQEYLKACGFDYSSSMLSKEKEGDILHELNHYIDGGGYPEVVVKRLDPKEYLTTLFDSVLFKDVVKRYNLRFPAMIHDLARYLVTNCGGLFTYSRLKNTLGFRSTHTVQEYAKYLKDSFVFFALKKFSHKPREVMKSAEKSYAYDTGMSIALKSAGTRDRGRLVENIVAVELLRRNREMYYFRGKNAEEVDFVIKSGLEFSELIQVCYDPLSPETGKREIGALNAAHRELSLKDDLPATIITWDYSGEKIIKKRKIKYVPLWKWILKLKNQTN